LTDVIIKRDNLTEDNFLLLAAKNYKKSYISTSEEWLSDIKRIKYIKKLLTRFKSSGIIDERLVLNHIIVLNNIFGPDFLCRVLWLKLGSYFEYIKPFLLYLGLLPDVIYLVDGKNVATLSIPMNGIIIERLRAMSKRDNQ
jgi:hypothetical protein